MDDKNPPSNNGTTPLYIAAQMGFYDICKFIIDNVNEKNPANHDGFTPLHVAALHGHLEICKLIIDSLVFTKK